MMIVALGIAALAVVLVMAPRQPERRRAEVRVEAARLRRPRS